MIYSNPTPPRRLTHTLENNFIAEVLPQEWEFWAPGQSLQLGGLTVGGGAPPPPPPEHLLWRPADPKRRSSTGLRKAEMPLLEPAHKVSGPKQWLRRSLGQTYLLVLEDLLGRQQVAVAHCGDEDMVVEVLGEYSSAWALLEGPILATRPNLALERIQFWDASRQTTN